MLSMLEFLVGPALLTGWPTLWVCPTSAYKKWSWQYSWALACTGSWCNEQSLTVAHCRGLRSMATCDFLQNSFSTIKNIFVSLPILRSSHLIFEKLASFWTNVSKLFIKSVNTKKKCSDFLINVNSLTGKSVPAGGKTPSLPVLHVKIIPISYVSHIAHPVNIIKMVKPLTPPAAWI